MPMKEMSIDQFVSRFLEGRDDITLFLGAGCSVSSGILTAGGLADLWYENLTFNEKKDADELAAKIGGDRLGAILTVMADHQAGRQAILNNAMKHARPSSAYAVMAHLIANSAKWSRTRTSRFRSILTTNFDDLIEQAFLIYTNSKPVVINHQTLFRYVSDENCIIKVHGDYRFAPQVVPEEIAVLPGRIETDLISRMKKTAIVFIGYGGRDPSIAKLFDAFCAGWEHCGLYWVNEAEPGPDLKRVLNGTQSTWVRHSNFDDLMFRLLNASGSEHPSIHRLLGHMDRYHTTFHDLLVKGKDAVSQPLLTAAERFQDWFKYVAMAAQHIPHDIPSADNCLKEGLGMFSQCPSMANQYAHFAKDHLKRPDIAYQYYMKALSIDPEHAATNSNLGFFLVDNQRYCDDKQHPYRIIKKCWDIALDADPSDLNTRVNYAGYLLSLGDMKKGGNMLDNCFFRSLSDTNCLEAKFYEYVHTVLGRPKDALFNGILVLLNKGVRSPHFTFKSNVDWAFDNNLPNAPLIEQLAMVISGEADLNTLDAFAS